MADNRSNGGQGLALFALFVALVANVMILLVSQTGVGNNARRAAEGQEAHDALCVLKDDIRRRIVNSQEFLDKNPHGIPGISASTIRQSIQNRQLTLDSLKNLKC